MPWGELILHSTGAKAFLQKGHTRLETKDITATAQSTHWNELSDHVKRWWLRAMNIQEQATSAPEKPMSRSEKGSTWGHNPTFCAYLSMIRPTPGGDTTGLQRWHYSLPRKHTLIHYKH